ncbi:hypothetical protein DMN91_004964 [Ooceraea biroi]|uniref:Uncharacterized protein n=1 Tax=Ooceraea biroi TaxID=2015173 RepID=A0A026WBB2_OOCBI|nr:hypothetical protein X777_06463 [Ooceraea biroi]RLU22686.1 hypothetical protein DMN91_004964 [Ooceraea biroi]
MAAVTCIRMRVYATVCVWQLTNQKLHQLETVQEERGSFKAQKQQWLPNYNWRPLDKNYDLSNKESTKKKTRMEFTKLEDWGQRMADPWIKKMQEISRQEREKWAAYKRKESGKLALDSVEETTKTNRLANNELISIGI